MGDYDDLLSTSERKVVQARGGIHESTANTLDAFYRGKIKKFAEEIEFMRGRLIGLVNGNHYVELLSGLTSDQLLADYLNTKYLGVAAFVRLRLVYRPSENDSKSRFHDVDLWLHHGTGSGRLPGATINGVARMSDIAEADIYISGHDHQRGAVPAQRLRLVNHGTTVRVADRHILYLRSGSFLLGYVDGHSTYITDAALRPSNLGAIQIVMTPRRTKSHDKDGRRMTHLKVDLKAIT